MPGEGAGKISPSSKDRFCNTIALVTFDCHLNSKRLAITGKGNLVSKYCMIWKTCLGWETCMIWPMPSSERKRSEGVSCE